MCCKSGVDLQELLGRMQRRIRCSASGHAVFARFSSPHHHAHHHHHQHSTIVIVTIPIVRHLAPSPSTVRKGRLAEAHGGRAQFGHRPCASQAHARQAYFGHKPRANRERGVEDLGRKANTRARMSFLCSSKRSFQTIHSTCHKSMNI